MTEADIEIVLQGAKEKVVLQIGEVETIQGRRLLARRNLRG
jgi:hypothetical protein